MAISRTASSRRSPILRSGLEGRTTLAGVADGLRIQEAEAPKRTMPVFCGRVLENSCISCESWKSQGTPGGSDGLRIQEAEAPKRTMPVFCGRVLENSCISCESWKSQVTSGVSPSRSRTRMSLEEIVSSTSGSTWVFTASWLRSRIGFSSDGQWRPRGIAVVGVVDVDGDLYPVLGVVRIGLEEICARDAGHDRPERFPVDPRERPLHVVLDLGAGFFGRGFPLIIRSGDDGLDHDREVAVPGVPPGPLLFPPLPDREAGAPGRIRPQARGPLHHLGRGVEAVRAADGGEGGHHRREDDLRVEVAHPSPPPAPGSATGAWPSRRTTRPTAVPRRSRMSFREASQVLRKPRRAFSVTERL